MFCSKCGKEIKEGDKICPSCGVRVENTVDFDTVKNFANEKVQETAKTLQDAARNYSSRREEEQQERKIKDIGDIFVQKSERKIAVIGEGYLSNLIHNGTFGKGFGVLTDRRFYFSGKCFYKAGKQYFKTDEERTVDLEDITATGFVYHKFLWLLWLGILFLIMTFVYMIGVMFYGNVDGSLAATMLFGVFSVLMIAAYNFFTIVFYEVSFPGGCIAVRASAYGVKELKKFDKALRLAKDTWLEGR